MAVKKPVSTGDTKEAEDVQDGYTRLVAPSGIETTVPDGILESLLDSGYVKK